MGQGDSGILHCLMCWLRIPNRITVNTIAQILILALLAAHTFGADIVFLDCQVGVLDGSTTYDPNTRTCGQGRYRVFTELDEAARALVDADTLYLRSGTYSSKSVGDYLEVHGNKVNYWTGALAVDASGAPEKRKLVSAYKGELVVIQAKPGASHYNPDPSDRTFEKSSHYYPQPAISIGGAYVDVRGLKTYGQVVISGHDITLEDCDLGGGGPHMNQGQVVAINSNKPGGVYNIVVRNNRIHHSCWGESSANGAAVMGYNFSAVIENNEFSDNYGPDIRLKDCSGQQGRSIIIRYNFFRPTSINPRGNAGVAGIGQDGEVDRILIHNNIFYRKSTGIAWDIPALKETLAYSNTFVDCGSGRGEAADISTWMSHVINSYNNVFFHSREGQSYYDLQKLPNSDYNLFYSTTGDTRWRNRYRNRGFALSAWQSYSGKDIHSVEKDPQFANATGSRAGDFKRKGNPRDVIKSPYGSVCGAYVTGNEIIGLIPKER